VPCGDLTSYGGAESSIDRERRELLQPPQDPPSRSAPATRVTGSSSSAAVPTVTSVVGQHLTVNANNTWAGETVLGRGKPNFLQRLLGRKNPAGKTGSGGSSTMRLRRPPTISCCSKRIVYEKADCGPLVADPARVWPSMTPLAKRLGQVAARPLSKPAHRGIYAQAQAHRFGSRPDLIYSSYGGPAALPACTT